MINNAKPKLIKKIAIHHANIRNPKSSLKRLRSSFRKIKVKLKLEEKALEVPSFLVLSEISNRSVSLFSSRKLKRKTFVTFNLNFPLAMQVRGIVRFCDKIRCDSPFHAQQERENYRMVIEFLFSSEAERRAVMDIYEKVRDESYVPTNWHVYVTEKMQVQGGLLAVA